MTTLKDIEQLLTTDKYMALAMMTEKQCLSLINKGILDEDDYSRWDNVQEECRCMYAEAKEEFSRL